MAMTDTQSPIWNQEEFIASLARQITARQFPPVVFIDLFLTEDCNFRCPYCFVEGKRRRHMSKEVAFAPVGRVLAPASKPCGTPSSLKVFSSGAGRALRPTVLASCKLPPRSASYPGQESNLQPPA